MEGAIDFLNMVLASRGTPGRQKISVLPTLKLTAGAVPTGLAMAVAEDGIVAILSRGLVNLIVLPEKRRR